MKNARYTQIDGVFGVRRLGAAFHSNKKRRQAAALQMLPPFQVLHALQLK
jgi:hypothetical protein